MTRDLVVSALRDVESLRKRLDSLLRNYDDASIGRGSPALKKTNGRLTDAGVERVRTMIDADHNDTDIAEELRVTAAAIRNQRLKYGSEKTTPRRRRRSS